MEKKLKLKPYHVTMGFYLSGVVLMCVALGLEYGYEKGLFWGGFLLSFFGLVDYVFGFVAEFKTDTGGSKKVK